MFVRPHHKPQFQQTCADLMGLPTTSRGLEVPGPREESTTGPSELSEDTKAGEGPLDDSHHPCPVTLLPLAALRTNRREAHASYIAVCRSFSVQET